jgi:transcriptional regulator with XRE-family HTH domain
VAASLESVIGAEVQRRRVAVGLTQAALAEAVVMEPDSIAAIEQARRLPSVATLIKLAAVLDCEPWQLLKRG